MRIGIPPWQAKLKCWNTLITLITLACTDFVCFNDRSIWLSSLFCDHQSDLLLSPNKWLLRCPEHLEYPRCKRYTDLRLIAALYMFSPKLQARGQKSRRLGLPFQLTCSRLARVNMSLGWHMTATGLGQVLAPKSNAIPAVEVQSDSQSDWL